MQKQVETLSGSRRDVAGKSAAKKLRREGHTPCVLYGHGESAESLSVPSLALQAALRHGDRILQLVVDDGAPQAVFVKEVQYAVLTGGILHVDFTKVRMDEKIETSIPVVLRGEAAGTRAGGVIEHTLHEIAISCLPDRIPDEIVVDVTDLNIGDAWHVADISPIEGVDFVTPGDSIVVACHMPRGEEEEEETIAEEEAEPVRVGEEEEEKEEEEQEGE